MTKTILIATDFSDPAKHAAHYAAHLSTLLGVSRLVLYHSYEILPTSADIPESLVLSDGRIRERSLELLEELKQSLSGIVLEDTTILTIANANRLDLEMNSLAATYDASMVVIGLSGKSLWEKLLVGSSTKKILNSCHLPVLVVPAKTTFKPIKKIVMGCDLQKVSETLPARQIKEFVHTLQAQLLAVHVDHREETHFFANMIREQYAFYDLFEGLDPFIEYVDNAETDQGILNYAIKQDAQMILLIAKNRSFFERLRKDSISRKLAVKATIPLLIMHA